MVADWDCAADEGFGFAAEGRRFFSARVAAGDAADVGEETLEMPAPAGEAGFVDAAFDVGGDGGVGPGEHGFVVGEDAF